MKYVLILLICLLSWPALAETPDMGAFRKIPVLEGGRLKPLDSFARAMLARFSGKDHITGLSPEGWLAESLFDPGKAVHRNIFSIGNSTVRHQLGLPDRKIPLYNYTELAGGLGKTLPIIEGLANKASKDMSADERDLSKIHEDALAYSQILRTFSLILPLDVALPDDIKTDGDLNYLNLQKYRQQIETAAVKIVRKKGEKFDSYTEQEKKTTLLAYQLKLLGDTGGRNQLLRLVPVNWDIKTQDWRAPWAVINEGQGSPQTAQLLSVWRGMAQAWQLNDTANWLTLSEEASILPLKISHSEMAEQKLKLEVFYNRLAPFEISAGFYIIALLLALAYLIGENTFFLKAGLLSLSAGALVHISAIGIRIYLLERPPVSTLYESLIFVGAVCAIIGILAEMRLKGATGLLIGSISSLMLTMLASSFGSQGDTLLMLTAVLNTQFWLATHVLCITFGYGWCIITALLAHLILAGRAFHLISREKLNEYLLTLILLSLIALLFTATGTILGGIWADQSWGRFWGWDPKENGALLIVLWLVWVLHGKLSGHLEGDALLAALSFLSVIVGCAWIGVNLLGVGLHSYGFSDGVFMGLTLFGGFEALLIAGLWYVSKQKNAP